MSFELFYNRIFIVSEIVKWSVSKCVIGFICIIKFDFDDDITRSNVLPGVSWCSNMLYEIRGS